MDNGPEFVSLALAEWAEQHAVKLEFIQPGGRTERLLSALTEHTVQKYSIFICSER
jgi:putative transposase